MRIVFVYWPFEDQGSGNVIQGYSEAAQTLGHEVAVNEVPITPQRLVELLR